MQEHTSFLVIFLVSVISALRISTFATADIADALE